LRSWRFTTALNPDDGTIEVCRIFRRPHASGAALLRFPNDFVVGQRPPTAKPAERERDQCKPDKSLTNSLTKSRIRPP
jgi:hypothetical protein